MPRSISRPSQLYPAGTYGPFALNGFATSNTTALVLTLTIENWPDVPVVAVASVTWQDGSGATFNIPGGVHLDKRTGLPRATWEGRVQVPTKPNGKADVSGGRLSIEVIADFNTALTFQAA